MSVNTERMRKYSAGHALSDATLRALPPEEKRRIVEAMGFSPMGANHTYDCPVTLGGSGFRCNCTGEPTLWAGPRDVQEMMGDTWEQRVARRRGER